MATGGEMTDVQKEVMKYLEEHRLTDKLNEAVNRVVKARPEDPMSLIIKLLTSDAAPPKITKLLAREVLDSRGNPTIEVDVYAQYLGQDKLFGRCGAPSGASTGSNEAKELRDDDKARYLGKGVLRAVQNVNGEISTALKGLDPRNLKLVDETMCRRDGTLLKEKLGGNSLTACSFAIAHAGAKLADRELFLHLASFFHNELPSKFRLPLPMVNILNGGKHAGGSLKIQEFMIIPKAGNSFSENLRIVTTVYHHLGKILVKELGPSAKNVGDEGGFAPNLESPDQALTYIETAISAAGFKVGVDVFLALDCAASEFYDGTTKKYEIQNGKFLTSEEMVQFYIQLKKSHSALISIEDGLDEKDYDGWIKLTAAMSEEFKDMMLVGDDLYTTNTSLISQGIKSKWANPLLLKVNQIGTISEAMMAAKMIFDDKGNVAVSHRSGETIDALISDLAVAIGAQYIKTGAPCRGERAAKYNRLLVIEEYLRQNNML